jgi:rubrerythrin
MNTKNTLESILKLSMDFTKIDQVKESEEILNDRELIRALRVAIAAEHDAASFYENIADSINDKTIKAQLQDIANEEKVHVGELEQILSTIDKEDQKFLDEGKQEVSKESSLPSYGYENLMNKSKKPILHQVRKPYKPQDIKDKPFAKPGDKIKVLENGKWVEKIYEEQK